MSWLFEKRYQLEDEPLGKGGMGAVYAGINVYSRKEVAVKLIRRELAERMRVRRFEREAIALAAVDHPNIVKLLECGETDTFLYLVMERARGDTLRTLIRRSVRAGKLIDVPMGLFIVEGVARAMIAAHKLGIVHRDIKPDNVVVGHGGSVVVLDFGLALRLNANQARITSTSETSPGAVPGTPRYMAAEQILGRHVDGRADVYAMGITLYETLSGRTPFDRWEDGSSSTTELWAHHIHATPSDIRDFIDCPAKVCEILQRCIQKRPEDRYATAAALASALRDAMREHPLVVEVTPPTDNAPSAQPELAVRAAAPRALPPPTASMQASFVPFPALPFQGAPDPAQLAAVPKGRGVGFTTALQRPEIPTTGEADGAAVPKGRGVGFTTVLKRPEIPERVAVHPAQRTPAATWVDVRRSAISAPPARPRTQLYLLAPVLGVTLGGIGALIIQRSRQPQRIDGAETSPAPALDVTAAPPTRVTAEPSVSTPPPPSSAAAPAASVPSHAPSASGAPTPARPKPNRPATRRTPAALD